MMHPYAATWQVDLEARVRRDLKRAGKSGARRRRQDVVMREQGRHELTLENKRARPSRLLAKWSVTNAQAPLPAARARASSSPRGATGKSHGHIGGSNRPGEVVDVINYRKFIPLPAVAIKIKWPVLYRSRSHV